MDFLCLVFNIKSGFPLIGFKYSVDFYCVNLEKVPLVRILNFTWMSMARITNPAWICLVLNSERISLSLNPRWISFVWILNSEWMYPLSGFSGVSCSSYLLPVQCSLGIGWVGYPSHLFTLNLRAGLLSRWPPPGPHTIGQNHPFSHYNLLSFQWASTCLRLNVRANTHSGLIRWVDDNINFWLAMSQTLSI